MPMICTMTRYPAAQTQGFLDVELGMRRLEAKGSRLSRMNAVIDLEGFRPVLAAKQVTSRIHERAIAIAF